jgi:hypothetical protein
METLSILNTTSYKPIDDSVAEIIRTYEGVKESTRFNPEETMEALQKRILNGEHDSISVGLVYGILLGHNWADYLIALARDKFKAASHGLTTLLPFLSALPAAAQLAVNMYMKYPETIDMLAHFLRYAPFETL